MQPSLSLFEELRIPEPVARAAEHKPWMRCSAWSEQEVILPKVKNALPGPWRNEVTPYLVEIMDTAALPWVREIVMSSGSQLGKSQWSHNFLGYMADRSPAMALVVMSDEVMAGRIVNERLRPLWLETPALRSLTSGITDALRAHEFLLNNGMSVHLAWASSEAKLASIPFEVVILDEVEKYRDRSAVPNAKARTRWFPHTYKLIETSTPKTSDGQIWQDLLACDEVRCYFCLCPSCGAEQRLHFDGIRWPEGERDPSRIEKRKLARYRCVKCDALWSDLERDLSVRMGRWKAVDREVLSTDRRVRAEAEARPAPEPVDRPRSVGFQISSIYSHFVSLSAIAAKFLRAVQGGNTKEALADLHNNELGEPFDDLAKIESPPVEALMKLRDPELPPMTVPAWADFVVAFCDMQQVGFYFCVLAVEKKLYPTRKALIHYGRIGTWEDLRSLVFEAAYPIQGSGETLGVWRAGVDTGGGPSDQGEWSRTTEAYNWLRQNGQNRIFGFKGQPRREGRPKLRLAPQDRSAGSKNAHRRGLVLWEHDVARFKDELAGELADKLFCPGPGCGAESERAAVAERGGLCPVCGGGVPGWQPTLILHSGTGPDWARQILAEEKHRQKDGSFEWTRVKPDNHYLDCMVGCLALISPEGGGVARAPAREREGRDDRAAGTGSSLRGLQMPTLSAPASNWVNGWR